MSHRFAGLSRTVLARHPNPWSAWTRWLSTPLVLVPLWTRRWSHAAIIGAWMAVNPVIVPRPADEHGWVHPGGPRRGAVITLRPRDTAMAVNRAATLAGVTALVAARRHRAAPAAGATAVVMALLLVHWRLMARYYDQHRRVGTGRAPNRRPAQKCSFERRQLAGLLRPHVTVRSVPPAGLEPATDEL